jgi:hypothetical protein
MTQGVKFQMQNNYNPTATAVWQAAVAANEAKLIAQGHKAAKARKLALAKARHLHPAAQAAVRRNISMNMDYIQGGVA